MSSPPIWAVAAIVALTAACMPRSRHDDSPASETHTTAGELLPGWTKVSPAPPNDVLRPTPEERAADESELLTAPGTRETPLEAALPDWVPASGRLTIVGAADLAKNLGVVDELDDAGAAP